MASNPDLGLYSSLELGRRVARYLPGGGRGERARAASRTGLAPSRSGEPLESRADPCLSCAGRGRTLGRTCFVCDGTGRRG